MIFLDNRPDNGQRDPQGDAQIIEMVVEPGGIEPPTSCMPCKRSPS